MHCYCEYSNRDSAANAICPGFLGGNVTVTGERQFAPEFEFGNGIRIFAGTGNRPAQIQFRAEIWKSGPEDRLMENFRSGGGYRVRTSDLWIMIPSLYRLS